jgi:hypothetical protein
MKKDTFYIVQYNDCYGNGDQKQIETLVKNDFAFFKWLEERNKKRVEAGEIKEQVEEFDLIPINLYKPNLFQVDLKTN